MEDSQDYCGQSTAKWGQSAQSREKTLQTVIDQSIHQCTAIEKI